MENQTSNRALPIDPSKMVMDDPFYKSKTEWAKHDAKMLRLSRKRQRVSGLEAVLEMHESIEFNKRDLPYIKQLKFRIDKTKRELRSMSGKTLNDTLPVR